MKKYALTSDKFEGCVEYRFGDDGRFCGVNTVDAALTGDQLEHILMHIPAHVDYIYIITQGTTGKLNEVFENVTFDRFWAAYDDKLNSSKKRAKTKWDRMCKNEQIKAYQHIGTYFRHIPQGTRKKYAETYLNSEIWNN